MRNIQEILEEHKIIKRKIENCKEYTTICKDENRTNRYKEFLKDFGIYVDKVTPLAQENILVFIAEKLNYNQFQAIVLRYGLLDGQKRTYQNAGEILNNKSRQRIHQLVKRAKEILSIYKDNLQEVIENE